MEIKIPSVGESVFEALVATWLRQDGDAVRKDEPVCEIETDKITMELNAEADGVLSIAVPAGTTVKIGTVIGTIREGAAAPVAESPAPAQAAAAAPAAEPPLSPSVRKMARERGISPEAVPGTGRGGRVTVDDLFSFAEKREQVAPSPAGAPPPAAPQPPAQQPRQAEPPEADRTTRTPMTPIRKRIAERLMAARQQTAMLTTFNEADLGRIVELRARHKEQFAKRHGVSLGFMSFFVKACVEALKAFPLVNARIDGNDIVRHNYYNIGIAIGADKGLVVPVLRDADRLHFWEIEQAIAAFVEKIKTNRLELSDLEGGTFSITNGGVYGSLLSTPILNPPQSGVLGMHAIQDRPVARDGQVVIRPMMYLALSYDHRIIDGREAVGFLRTVKEYVEDPEELFLEG
ncbi:2-oxoglutarate dehydrogenase complex dihydrolipoyllysine-residue succinyltransferase [Geobacter sulfurreducens]|uniref:2-oxoglutarate dehydrogenase complex dihydrolipoyllysine-residue succinyltransferase n=1 Tax=Geobacter sulfurreducens TaxID=35554 RepID=UPI000DBB7C92|nr:2-oxoglutarate dehydrogenase complex dihydrolipoyllysine-residue succinyltransferase [Geobacter sulfurreducens]BBA70881.1 Dihydrolipoyllysine-residue succinyltransferase component of 2-oxoglutarate dehydrogenase complex [Geobacter sulfurreducens]